MPNLCTERLRLLTFTRPLLAAARRLDRGALARSLGISVSPRWPSDDLLDAIPVIERWIEESPPLEDWCSLIVRSADLCLIGDIGFKTLPDWRGAVELGYGLVPEARGLGYATEAARAMIAWAGLQPGVRAVTACCDPHNHASIRVLQKLGMRQTGTQDGELCWELRLSSWRPAA